MRGENNSKKLSPFLNGEMKHLQEKLEINFILTNSS